MSPQRLHRNYVKLKSSKGYMKGTNLRLKAEKDEFKVMCSFYKTSHCMDAESVQTDVHATG